MRSHRRSDGMDGVAVGVECEGVIGIALQGSRAVMVCLAEGFGDGVGHGRVGADLDEGGVIGPCGGAFCVTLKTGKHAGKQIGKLSGKGNSYSGEITDPANDKTYSGSGTVSGNSLSMKGCVLKVLCKSQTWTRL